MINFSFSFTLSHEPQRPVILSETVTSHLSFWGQKKLITWFSRSRLTSSMLEGKSVYLDLSFKTSAQMFLQRQTQRELVKTDQISQARPSETSSHWPPPRLT